MQYIIILLTEVLANSGLSMERTIEEFQLVFIMEKLLLISIWMPIIQKNSESEDDLSPPKKKEKSLRYIFF